METIIRTPAFDVQPRVLELRRTAADAQLPAAKSLAPSESGVAQPDDSSALPAMEEMLAELRAKAMQEVEALRECAEQQGFQAGLERAETTAREAVAAQAQRLATAAAQLQQHMTAATEAAEDLIVETVFAATCRILGEAAASPQAVRRLVLHVLRQVRERSALRVKLHPDDLALLREKASEPALASGGVVFEGDAALVAGGCVVDTGAGTLDARLDRQLERLRDVLLEARRARQEGL